MTKKSTLTQELVNVYPPWTKVRTDEQSVGQQLLNTFAIPMERMEKKIMRMRDNQYLTTANLDEIDLTFKVQLDADFTFDEDTTDPLFSSYIPPTVSGLIDGTWYLVNLAERNDLESFWDEAIPERVTLEDTVSGIDYELVTVDSDDIFASGVWEHHLGGGRMWVEATGGVEYLTFEDGELSRGKVIISGRTRKGTEESETIIFPWDMKQPTLKEWKQITEITVADMEDGIDIDIRSADFNSGPYLSPWNLRYSENRNKIDEFWDLGHNDTIPTLDRIEYQSDEWQQLVIGFSTKDVKESWELLEDTNDVTSGIDITVSGVDMAIQPYTDRVWVATEDRKLYVYDLLDNTVSGVEDLRDSTHGAHVQLDYDTTSLLLGEDIEFVPWHARPLKEIQSYQVWYQRPDGQKFGLLNGVSVDYTSDFTVVVAAGTEISRTVEDYISIPTSQRGEYLVVIETTFVDGEVQEFRRIFSVKYKTPLAVLDISPIISTTIDGVDFDSDQKLWVRSGTIYYKIGLHTDVMLIDYDNKIIYFKEDYSEVTIDTDD